ncbi:hypothetical protein [Rossellomorea sp. BNER]|uniref:hypothetical protein n=1 Tax=Rossellomorea sp. BNER TaxID=2962031 RepID=UPI003AF2C2B1
MELIHRERKRAMFEKITKKVFIMLAILIVLFQSFSIPALAAIQPWKGNSWEGNPWEGDPWDGADLQWKGESWEGSPWEGSTTEGNDWEGNGTEGQGTKGNGTQGQDWQANQWYLDPWEHNGWNPNDFNGNGTHGIPFNGNGTNGNPFTGNGSEYQLTESSSVKEPAADDSIYSGYDWFKFGVSDIGLGMLQTFGENNIDLSDLGTWNTKSKTFYLKLLETSFKFSAKDISLLEAGGDALDVGKNVKDFRSNLQNVRDTASLLGTRMSPYISNPQLVIDGIRNAKLSNIASSAAQFGSNTSNAFKAMAPLGKLNVIGAAVGAGFSAVDSFNNTVKLFNADTGKERVAAGADLAQSSGSLLMNVGTGIAAFPGGQVIGGALIAGGAVLWLGGTVVKHWGTIKEAVTNPVKTVKKLGKGIADKAKKTWSTVKGWFS